MQTFKRRYYNNVYVGTVMLVIAFVAWLAKSTIFNKAVISTSFVLAGILMISQNLIQRIRFTEDTLSVSGLFPKEVSYSNIDKIEIGEVMAKTGTGMGTMRSINIFTKQGKQIKLMPYNFANYEGERGWASLLLKVTQDHAIDIEPNAEQNLQRAAKAKVYKPQF
jgi:hypothetical protein